MRISIPKTVAKLTNYNPNSELHGDERVPVSYIRFRMTVENKFLDQLHGTLKPALFFHDVENPGNDLADKAMENNPDYLPHLRFPLLDAPLKWKDAMEGGKLTLHRGISKKSHIVLADIKLDDLKVVPKAGGVVELTFRVRAKPDEEECGKLAAMHQQDIEISVEPPLSDEERQPPLGAHPAEPAAPVTETRH